MENKNMNLTNDRGLFIDAGSNRPLGYLFSLEDKGIFSPDGQVLITKEQAETHNRLLTQAEIEGLDNCKIGQRGTLYYKGSRNYSNNIGSVTTWTGEIVAGIPNAPVFVKVSPKQRWSPKLGPHRITSIIFWRKGMRFSGRLQADADCFNFKRTL
jgi:hypothetical protein